MKNKVNAAGNLTRDPELKVLPGGTTVVEFSFAVNDRYKNKDGDMVEETEYVNCKAFGKTAEFVSKYFTKGKAIEVLGKLKTDTWDDKTSGEKKYATRVIVTEVEFPIGNGKKTETDDNDDDETPEPPFEAKPKASAPKKDIKPTGKGGKPPKPSKDEDDENVDF